DCGEVVGAADALGQRAHPLLIFVECCASRLLAGARLGGAACNAHDCVRVHVPPLVPSVEADRTGTVARRHRCSSRREEWASPAYSLLQLASSLVRRDSAGLWRGWAQDEGRDEGGNIAPC